MGLGIDLVEHDRIRSAIERWGGRFKNRVFLPREQTYCDSKAHPWRHYAGRFAVKEAVSKAFGSGIGEHINWLDIEVSRDETTGAPSVVLSPAARQYAATLGATRVLVSLSHAGRMTVAQALLLR
jgi:holo-[acyl-carrier protein] synthase